MNTKTTTRMGIAGAMAALALAATACGTETTSGQDKGHRVRPEDRDVVGVRVHRPPVRGRRQALAEGRDQVGHRRPARSQRPRRPCRGRSACRAHPHPAPRAPEQQLSTPPLATGVIRCVHGGRGSSTRVRGTTPPSCGSPTPSGTRSPRSSARPRGRAGSTSTSSTSGSRRRTPRGRTPTWSRSPSTCRRTRTSGRSSSPPRGVARRGAGPRPGEPLRDPERAEPQGRAGWSRSR